MAASTWVNIMAIIAFVGLSGAAAAEAKRNSEIHYDCVRQHGSLVLQVHSSHHLTAAAGSPSSSTRSFSKLQSGSVEIACIRRAGDEIGIRLVESAATLHLSDPAVFNDVLPGGNADGMELTASIGGQQVCLLRFEVVLP